MCGVPPNAWGGILFLAQISCWILLIGSVESFRMRIRTIMKSQAKIQLRILSLFVCGGSLTSGQPFKGSFQTVRKDYIEGVRASANISR